MNNIPELIKSGALVLDVRTPGEYSEGHFSESINIPLNEIPARIGELKDEKEIIVCCASGIRSGKAISFLKQHGISCYDGGSWLNLKNMSNPNTR
ncbi:rhodanese-like domain-containing protein [Mucilaginibacter ginsenosidivorans]|uniref:Rhodanese-like domain-containing protein n=1 Tax=Mucilaginibacter ginsenosidivorans TaxID=398053 RepID=A0A5B8UWM1_9SPHI|nr:rhodanese-like domain-containing protein [Mucilaginibacter ginsenosidivorans]QEC63547.1 rhodanese-like domain-containing protein [Mucilaginibacter ginsenosidivorans]